MSEDIYLLLGRLEGKLDTALRQQQDNSDEMDELDSRVTKLETWKTATVAYAAGFTAALGALATAIYNLPSR